MLCFPVTGASAGDDFVIPRNLEPPMQRMAAMTHGELFFCSAAFLILLAGCGSPEKMKATGKPPHAIASRSENVKDVIHGVEVRDPYRWLENNKSPEVQAWMKDQDTSARKYLGSLSGRAVIARRLRELYYADETFPPVHRGNRYFYSRRLASKDKSIVCWKEGKGGEEKILFDPNAWSEDGSASLGVYSFTEDGKTVAYSVRRNNSDEATLHVMDVASGKQSAVDVIEGAKYADPSWTPDGRSFYYTWLPTDPSISASERPGYAEVRLHRLGESPAIDAVIRGKTGDPTSFIAAGVSRDGHWLMLQIQHGWTSNDVWFRNLQSGQQDWTSLAAGVNAMYEVQVWRDVFYVRTNEGAGRYRVFRVDPAKPQRDRWAEIVTERKDATLDGMSIVGERLALSYLKDAASRLEIRELNGRFVREVQLPGVGTASGLMGNEDEDEAYFSFVSYAYPRQILSTSVKTGESREWGQLKIPVDPSAYEVEQVWFRSKDDTKLSMFLVRRKGMEKTGKTPTLLYGYGGFQVSLTPSFRPSIYPWLEHGGIYAEVNLRGGGEYGEDWHRAGMLDKKQNVFDDFAAAANFLIGQGYTRREQLAIFGGSNGGLLVGAAMTQNPGLFRAVICAVPLLDMVRYHLFGSGKTWIHEYGSADDPAQFRTLLGYSPYHHVSEGAEYPALLLLSADSDDRVDPMHARKFAAAVQSVPARGPVLLRIETNAGHGGADMIKASIERDADMWAFLFSQIGS
jgi:prolyl oligopeptidase